VKVAAIGTYGGFRPEGDISSIVILNLFQDPWSVASFTAAADERSAHGC